METELASLGFDQLQEETQPSPKETLAEKAERKAVALLVGGVIEAIAYTEKIPRLRRTAFELAASTACLVVRSVCKKDIQAHHPLQIPFSENPNFRPFSESLEAGILLFKSTHPDIPVTWISEVEDIRQGLDLSLIAKGAQKLWQGKTEINHLVDWVIDTFSPKQRELIKEAQGEDVGLALDREYVNSFRSRIRQVGANLSRPITQAELISESLAINTGNLNSALNLLRNFYYRSTRAEGGGERSPQAEERQKQDVEEFASLILDQFSEFNPYNDLPYQEFVYGGTARDVWRATVGRAIKSIKKEQDQTYYDFSLNNRTGEPYHGTHLVEFLAHFMPEAIAMFMMGEYLGHSELHGLAKFLADLRVVSDLYNVKDVIKRHTVETPPPETHPSI